ncbi:hypothetical protein PR048_008570 [Dryococelus australis]|uniref:Uncharacterized protein n=1 Tax=Dryococelus australis TaxID=614101 RepID=A0ABQ9HXG9_9NEOP|nr:hypothetical protein PR048_008570 [Dryococelus australis]
MRVIEVSRSSSGVKGRGKLKIPKKTLRPVRHDSHVLDLKSVNEQRRTRLGRELFLWRATVSAAAPEARRLEAGLHFRQSLECPVERVSSPTVASPYGATGATVAEQLACSSPTKAIRVQSSAGSLRIFACGNRAGRCRWSASLLGDLQFPPPPHSGAAPYLNRPHRLSTPRYNTSGNSARRNKDRVNDRNHVLERERRSITPHCNLRVRRSLAEAWRGDRTLCSTPPVTAPTGAMSEPGSIPLRATPGFLQVGIVPDDAAGRLIFSGISRFPPPLHSGASPFLFL